MKTNKETRRAVKKLFRTCLVNGQMDEKRVRAVVSAVAAQKPRYYLGILSAIEKLVKMETQKHSLHVETATSLEENRLHEIHTRVQSRFTVPLTASHSVNPILIGGIRIQVGSDVWDGSVAARLRQLEVKN